MFDDAVFDPDDYLYFYEDTLREERTADQVDRLAAALALAPPMRVLDLGCGHGRHAIELARRGFRVTGVDRVQGFLDLAARDAQRVGASVEFLCRDLRTLDDVGPFDAAVCLFDAFGLHRDDENRTVLANMARALAPGGSFCLDLRNRDWMVRHLQPTTVLTRGGDYLVDRHGFDSRTGRLVDRRVVVRNGQARETPFSVRLYTPGEIEMLLASVGLAVREMWGDWRGAPVSVNLNRLVVLGERAR